MHKHRAGRRQPPLFILSILALLLSAVVGPAPAQEWPAKPIKLIVPFPPGGGTDIVSRVLAHRLGETLKQAIVVENRPGAGGNIGLDIAAKSPADGYTMVMGQTSNLAINATLYEKLPYDPIKDLAPVALVADAPIVLVTAADSKFKSLAELLVAAKAAPGSLTFATPGNGTVAHLTGESLQRAAGIKLVHVPYRGAGPALQDVIGGRVDAFLASVPSAMGQIQGGRVRPLAVSSAKRSALLPQTPTIAEAGVAGFDATTWFGILLPAGAPQAVIDRLNAEINAALRTPEVSAKIASEGGAALGGTPQEFARLLAADLARWRDIVKASGAKVD